MHGTHDKWLEHSSKQLFAYAVALTRDQDKASDLFQECVVRVISARSVPDNERAFRTWLFTVLRNLWIDQVRARNREMELRSHLSDSIDPEPLLDSIIVNRMSVRQAFASLRSEHRDILALIDIAGFRYGDVAEILSIPKGTVMSRVSRARRAMANLLQESGIAGLPDKKRHAHRA